MDRALRRSARSQGRRGRLGRTNPLLRDAELRAADHGEPAGLSRAVRRRDQTPDRSRPASRRQRRIAFPACLVVLPLGLNALAILQMAKRIRRAGRSRATLLPAVPLAEAGRLILSRRRPRPAVTNAGIAPQ